MARLQKALLATLLLGIAGYFWSHRQKLPNEDMPAVVAQIQRLNQLATVRYTVQKVIGLREPKVPVGEESILLILQANVQAGVDLGGLREDDFTRRPDGTLVIRIPPAKVLNVAVDEKQTKVWDRQKTWWTPWVPYSMELEQKARAQGLDEIRKSAVDMGILGQAQRNAETSIRGLLGLAGVTKVLILPSNAS